MGANGSTAVPPSASAPVQAAQIKSPVSETLDPKDEDNLKRYLPSEPDARALEFLRHAVDANRSIFTPDSPFEKTLLQREEWRDFNLIMASALVLCGRFSKENVKCASKQDCTWSWKEIEANLDVWRPRVAQDEGKSKENREYKDAFERRKMVEDILVHFGKVQKNN